MLILMLCYEYPPLGGGGGVGAQQYAEAFARHGHHVTVITGGTRMRTDRQVIHDVEVIRVGNLGRRCRATSTLLSMLWYNIRGCIYMLSHRRELGQYQVINTHFAIPTGPLGYIAAKVLNRPNVLTIIGGDIYDPSKRLSPHRNAVLRWLNHALISNATRVIAISSDTRQRAQRYYKPAHAIEVINYGFTPPSTELSITDEGRRQCPERGAADKCRLVAVGRLVRRKSFGTLIKAMAMLPDSIQLTLIGDGPERDGLYALARQLSVKERIEFKGYQSRQVIIGYMRESDIFVMPSLHEGLGIVVQEAMYAGLPIIATNVGGQVDLIKHGVNGLLVPPNNPSAFAEAITLLYGKKALRKSMGRHNLRDIAGMHIDVNCHAYLKVFDEVTGNCCATEAEVA